jgi:hypothetical protein
MMPEALCGIVCVAAGCTARRRLVVIVEQDGTAAAT